MIPFLNPYVPRLAVPECSFGWISGYSYVKNRPAFYEDGASIWSGFTTIMNRDPAVDSRLLNSASYVFYPLQLKESVSPTPGQYFRRSWA